MNAFLWVVRKDLALFFADKRGAVMVVVVPLVLGLMMGFIFNPSRGPEPLDVVAVDEDGGANVGALIARLEAEPSLKIEKKSAAEARKGVEEGTIAVAVDFAPGTSAELSASGFFAGGAERKKLVVWVDPSHQTEADIVTGLLTKAMMETVFSQMASPDEQQRMFSDLRAGLAGSQGQRPELERFLDQGVAFAKENNSRKEPGDGGMALHPPMDITVEPLVAAGPTAGFNGFAHTFAGMLMQFLLFTASSQAKTLLAERSSGLLDRVRMTRATPAQILLGTGAAIAIVSLMATVVVFGVGMAFCGIELRSGPLAFGLVALGQASFTGSAALLLVGLANTEKQLDSIGMLVILFLCFVSGAWVPAFMLPGFLQSLGPFIPTRWILDGMAGATWRGLGLLHAAKCAGILLLFSAVFATVGLKRFRWG